MRAATYTPNFGHTATRTWNLRPARNVALFVLAPFVGLAYAVAFPLVGLAMLVYMAVKK